MYCNLNKRQAKSSQVVAILNVLMGRSAQSALESIFRLNLNTLGAFVDFVSNYFTASTNNNFQR